MADDGLEMFSDLPGLKSFVRKDSADLDIEGTYPNGQVVLNISRETTTRELVQIQGVDPLQRRLIGINLTGGHVNASEIAVLAMGAKTMDEALAAYDQRKAT